MKNISIGYSPCPNDTFIFDAMVHGKIDTGDFIFEPVLADVEELNRMAMDARLDVTKISIGAYAAISNNYVILDSGSALGKGVGPLLVSKYPIDQNLFGTVNVAIPGKNTTANLLLSTFFPEIRNKTEMIFSAIEDSVLTGETDAGLLIHEGRFTYSQKGLHKLFDLGEVWEAKIQIPLPLGCITARRSISQSDKNHINKIIQSSIEYAFKHPIASKQYIREHAVEMDENVIESHIALYVNEYSLNLGTEGRNAIEFLLKKGADLGLLPSITKPIFN